MNKLERKFGKYAIPHLTLVFLVLQAIGYAFNYLGQGALLYYILLSPYEIMHGQVWRLVTWLMVPSRDILSFLIVALLFYYPIGTQMERTWGDFRYNMYLFSGVVFTVIGAFFLYAYYALSYGGPSEILRPLSITSSFYFSPYYVMLSIFFAYAATFPDSMVLFMFIIPLKMKWLGFLYAAYLIYDLFTGSIETRVVIIASLLNFAFFYALTHGDTMQRYKPQEVRRRREFRENNRIQPAGRTHHRCAVCGATEVDHPQYEFRYCSKCNGTYEYCQEHLFTHTHVT